MKRILIILDSIGRVGLTSPIILTAILITLIYV